MNIEDPAIVSANDSPVDKPDTPPPEKVKYEFPSHLAIYEYTAASAFMVVTSFIAYNSKIVDYTDGSNYKGIFFLT